MSEPRAIETLADFLVSAQRRDIPDAVFDRAADCVLDVLGAAAAGQSATATRLFRQALMNSMAHGKRRIWFTNQSATAPAAAAINAMAATALDVDDGHRLAAGHPGAAVISAAATAAEETDASLEEFLVAVVLGYEASIRVALARRPEQHPSTVSGRWSGVGAAVAAARLRGSSARTMANAILISEQHAPRVSAASTHGFAGSHVKEGIAWSVLTAMIGTELATEGFIGYPDVFDQDILYDPAALVLNLNAFEAIGGLFFKPYACCRWIHAALDGVADVMAAEKMHHDGIKSIEVQTFARAVELGNHPAPRSDVDAQFSIPFCVGVVATRGREALMPLDGTLLADPAVLSVARKTRVSLNGEMDAMFSHHAPAIVRIEGGQGVFQRRVETPFGDPTHPMERCHLQDKFRRLAPGVLGSDRTEGMIARLSDLSDAGRVEARDVFPTS